MSGASGSSHVEEDLVSLEEPPHLAAGRVEPMAHEREPRLGRLGEDVLEAADALARELAELERHLG
jgi:hypothetical protein